MERTRNSSPDPEREASRPFGMDDGMVIFLAAVGWLALGSGGLLWAIAFTDDSRSLTLALLVWGLAFVVPTIIATLAAYHADRQDDSDETTGSSRQPERDETTGSSRQTQAPSSLLEPARVRSPRDRSAANDEEAARHRKSRRSMPA